MVFKYSICSIRTTAFVRDNEALVPIPILMEIDNPDISLKTKSSSADVTFKFRRSILLLSSVEMLAFEWHELEFRVRNGMFTNDSIYGILYLQEYSFNIV